MLCHKSLLALILRVLASFVNSKTSHDGNDRHEPSTATARTETTRGPTYSMARAIGATAWQKGCICQCHYLRCHSQWKSLVTWTNLSSGHMRAIACHKRWQECNLSVDMSCKAHGVLDPCACSSHTPGMTCQLDHAWPVFCIVHVCRFCFIYCGLRFYAQSHSDNGHVHATAPCFAHALTQARPTMSCIPLVMMTMHTS